MSDFALTQHSSQIVLPTEQFTPIGWRPDHELSHEEWKEVGRALARVSDAVNWWVGDWLLYGDFRSWGDKFLQAYELFNGKYELETLRALQRVSDHVNMGNRLPNLSWTHHREVATLDAESQVALLGKAEQNRLSVRDLHTLVRDHERKSKLVEKGIDVQATDISDLPAGIYSVIYADPPWQYDNSGFDQSAEEHYPTMTIEDLCDLPVGRLADEPCALYMWATVPLMPEAFSVMQAWGFEYRSHRIWVKNKAPGMGWWLRTNHEVLLIATRNGNAHPSERVESVVEHPVGRHSEKPSVFREDIERCHDGPRVELFARERADGWDSWGNEV